MSLSTIDLPWPERALHPNTRVHWGTRARAAKKARKLAAWETRVTAGVTRIKADALLVTAVFCPPDRRPRDDDNMLSSIKSYLDGIADVIGVDDSKWHISLQREEPRKNGAVRIVIEDAA